MAQTIEIDRDGLEQLVKLADPALDDQQDWHNGSRRLNHDDRRLIRRMEDKLRHE